MAQLASMIVDRGCVPTRHALVCSTYGSAHRYDLFFCNPRLHGALQEQVHCSLRSGLLLQRRLLTCTTQSKSHSSTASAANASGSLQTTLSNCPDRTHLIPALWRVRASDRALSFVGINRE